MFQRNTKVYYIRIYTRFCWKKITVERLKIRVRIIYIIYRTHDIIIKNVPVTITE